MGERRQALTIAWWQTRGASIGAVAVAAVIVVCLMAIDPVAYTDHEHVWTVVLMVLVFLGALAVCCGGLLGLRVETARAREAFTEGRYADAAREFAAIADCHRIHATLHATALAHYALAQLYDGQHEAAIAALLQVEQLAPRGATRRSSAPLLARCFALTGDMVRAHAWLAATRERVVPGATPYAANVRWQLTGLLLCRRGEYDEACEHYLRGKQLVKGLPELDRAEVALLFAFATTVSTGKADTVLGMLKGLRARRSRLPWVTKQWPEIATFAATHGFDIGPAERATGEHVTN